MLEQLENRIMAIKPLPDGTFEVYEKCDEVFGTILNRAELIQLADEIRALAGEEVDDK